MSELEQIADSLRRWLTVEMRTRGIAEIAESTKRRDPETGVSRAAIYNFLNGKPSWKVAQALIKEREQSNGDKAA